MSSAILLALITILLWSFLAYLSSSLNSLPPLLLVGIPLCVGGLMSFFQVRTWRVPLKTFAVGLGGIFGYHFLLFTAFSLAPTVEANLVNYLWPLLIVLLSPLFLRGYTLKAHHLVGALLGMSGAALIVTGGQLHLDVAHLPGYLCAAAAALIWACYSLLSKCLPPFPTTAVGGFCFFSGLLSLGVYVLQGNDFAVFQSLRAQEWLYLVLLGVGPLGAAFLTWDAALKRGDPRIIGALSYLTPLASTSWLVLLGGKNMTWISGVAMFLIVSGALVGSWEVIKRKP